MSTLNGLNGTRDRRRSELASFLRSRRERIAPADVGMPPGPRRRTPGLRREEVAQLAGVGVTWYTWLEQGRPINASMQVLDSVARTLRLDPAEREHLYRLADMPDAAVRGEGAPELPPEIPAILRRLHPLPASVVNSRYDLLAWNDAYATLFPHAANAPGCERNMLWMIFTLPECCNPVPNLDEVAPRHVAVFRQAYSRHFHEPAWKELVRRLCAASPLFARLWATHDVADPGPHDKIYHHPRIGRIPIRTTSFDVTGATEARMVVYSPNGEDARVRLDRLIGDPGSFAPGHTH